MDNQYRFVLMWLPILLQTHGNIFFKKIVKIKNCIKIDLTNEKIQ